jgi:hypothetical protein
MQPEVFDSRALALLNRLASRKKDPTPPPGRPVAPSAADVALASPAARSALISQMKTTGGVAISDRPGTLCNMLIQLEYISLHYIFLRIVRPIPHCSHPCAQSQGSSITINPRVGRWATPSHGRRANQVSWLSQTHSFSRHNYVSISNSNMRPFTGTACKRHACCKSA